MVFLCKNLVIVYAKTVWRNASAFQLLTLKDGAFRGQPVTPKLIELGAIVHQKQFSFASQCDHGIHFRCAPGRNKDGQQSRTHQQQRSSAKHERIVCLDGEEQAAH